MQPIEQQLLAILFASGDPIAYERLAQAVELSDEQVLACLQSLQAQLDRLQLPFCLLQLQDSYQLATRAEYAPLIRQVLAEKKSVPLSQAAMEVLAIVAYHQPVTHAYVEEVRGVDSRSALNSLVEKGLLEEAGRLDLPGRPIAYRTTAQFLRCFGLSSLQELPTELQIAHPDGQDSPVDADSDVLEGQMQFSS